MSAFMFVGCGVTFSYCVVENLNNSVNDEIMLAQIHHYILGNITNITGPPYRRRYEHCLQIRRSDK